MNGARDPDASLERVPLFPLPDFVVFPGTPVQLYFFEPRYRALALDVVAGDKLMVTTRLDRTRPSDADGPAIEPVGTLTRVIAHRQRPDGTHDAVLLGLGRVALGPAPLTPRGYRVVDVTTLEERMEVPRELHTALVACAARIVAQLRVRHPDLKLEIEADAPACRVVDMLADRFVADPDLRSRLLAMTDAAERADVVLERLTALGRELVPSGPAS